MVQLNQGGDWLNAGNAEDGGIVTFKNEGTWVESNKYTYPDGNPKQDFVMTVNYKDKDYQVRVNKLSRDALVPELGGNTQLWIDKEAKIVIETYRTLGKKGIILVPNKKDSPVEKVKSEGVNLNTDTQEWE